MPEVTSHYKRIKKEKSVKRKRTRKNGEIAVSLENLIFPSYEQIKEEVMKKAGKIPSLPAGLPKGAWSPQALRVLEERYLVRGEEGEVIEDPEEMCWRVAWEIASAEALWGNSRHKIIEEAKIFYKLLSSKEFLPNSPTLMNAGTGNKLQYAGCFVIPVEDSLVGIFDAIKYQALVHQSGGGTGFSFSRLRPRGSIVGSSKGTASGPVSFMRIFDAATNEIKQGGKRRGANMGILRVDHPDILEFISCKDGGGITNFNISVAVTDRFMEAYDKNQDYDLVDPKSGKIVGTLNAKEVFDKIAEGAWKTGDPGVIFIDRMNSGSANPVPVLGPIESTNPCGEQPLYPFDSCNLGSIFLSYFVEDGEIDWQKLKTVTRLAVRFMDNVIEMNPYPLEQIRKTSLAIRRIGLGVGGWADMLAKLGVPYDSEKALELAELVMKTIEEEGARASEELAIERGPFPLWSLSIYKNALPRRNSTVTTIAPTGSISIIADTSSGIEPLFALAFQHIVKDKSLDRTLSFVNPYFEETALNLGLLTDELKSKILEHGTIREIEELPQNFKDVFGTAHEIYYTWHVKMQAAFQKYTENAVSKTINLKNEATVDDIKEAYLLAWKTECKGVTVFRDGSKGSQVLNLGVKKEGEEASLNQKTVDVWERPMTLSGTTYKIRTPVGTAFITVNEDGFGNPIEVFINIGKAGSDIQAMAEALGRLISKSLKFGGNLTAKERAMVIIDQLKGIGGRTSVGFGPSKIRSLPEGVAYALSNYLGIGNGNGGGFNVVVQEEPEEKPEVIKGDICPSCGSSSLVYEEGCVKCLLCGHSEC